eukprot:scaffold7616_cov69-Phaeocystis_antarctica.AAC.2
MLYYEKGCGAVVEVTVIRVHRDDDTPCYTIELPSRQERQTTRERLWHEGEAPPPTARADAPADEAQQARAYVAWPSRHALNPHTERPCALPYPRRAVSRRARYSCHVHTQAGAARGGEAGATADEAQQARAYVAWPSRHALNPLTERPCALPYPRRA